VYKDSCLIKLIGEGEEEKRRKKKKRKDRKGRRTRHKFKQKPSCVEWSPVFPSVSTAFLSMMAA